MFERAPTDQQGVRRWRLLARSASAAAAARAVGLACMLAQVALALRYLGAEAFGFWMTLSGTAALLQFLDLGLSHGMQNQVSAAHGRGDGVAAQDIVRCAFAMLTLVALVLLGAGLLMLPHVDAAAFFHVRDPAVRAASGRCLVVVLVAFCVSLPLNAGHRLAVALQQGWLSWVAIAFTGLCSVGAAALGMVLHLALPEFLALSLLPGLLMNGVLLAWMLRRLGWGLRWPDARAWTRAPALLRESVLFMPPQAGAALLGAAPAVMLAALLGPLAVTPFNLAQRLGASVSQLHAMLVLPAWPAYAEAAGAGDYAWVRATFRISIFYSAAFLLPCLLFGIAGGKAVQLWTHDPGAAPSAALLWWMAAWTFATILGAPTAMLLNALGRLTGQATYGVVCAILGVALIPTFVARWGAAGVPAALLATYVPVALPLTYLEAARALRRMGSDGGVKSANPIPKS